MGSLTSNDGTITGVDSGNAIGAKVVFAAAMDGTDFRDWISDEVIDTTVITGLSKVSDGTHGDVLDLNEADVPNPAFTYSNLGPLGTGITFSGEAQYAMLLKSDDADVTSVKNLFTSSGAGDDALTNCYRGSDESFKISINSGSSTDIQATGTVTWTNWNMVGGSRNNPDGGRTILNGTEGSRDTTLTGNPNDIIHNLRTGRDHNGEIALVVVFDEELTTAQNSSFSSNPWQIFSGAAASTTPFYHRRHIGFSYG